MVEELFHQVPIQLERDEKSTSFTTNQSHLQAVVKIINDFFNLE